MDLSIVDAIMNNNLFLETTNNKHTKYNITTQC